MTSFPTRRVALGVAATASVLGTLTAVAPALAASPSYPVVCASAHVDAPRNQTTTFDLSCEDAEGNAVDSYVVLTQPAKAQAFTVDTATGAVSYRPVAGAHGTDTFTFKGVDGLGESAPTTAAITFENERPTCAAGAPLTVVHDDAVVVPIECTDADGDALTVTTGTTGATHGTVSVADGKVVYTPAAGYTGADTFSLRAGDGGLLSSEVDVAVTVTNARPTCTSVSGSTVHDRAKILVAMCTDADGDALTHSVVAVAQHGNVTLQGTKLTYKPATGYVGSDTFTVAATDGLGAAVPARFTVKVTNAIPTCKGGGKLTAKAKAKSPVKFTCRDADRDAVSVVVAAAPKHGDLVRRGKAWFYVADKGYRGKDTFSLKGTDGVSSSKAVKYAVTVKPARKR
jgi:hypothetical protein